jgi:hypothetical protein
MNDNHDSGVAAHHYLLGSGRLRTLNAAEETRFIIEIEPARRARSPLAPSPFAWNCPPGEIAVASL